MLNISKRHSIFTVASIIIILIPIIAYFISINKLEPFKNLVNDLNLSDKNEDWGDFGSFISGVYGSIFSFLSLLAVLLSLYMTQRNNAEQISILKSEQHTNEFLVLLDTLQKLFSEKVYEVSYGPQTFNNFASHIYYHASVLIYEDRGMTKDKIDEYALDFTNKALKSRGKRNLEKEAPLISEIIQKINVASDSQSMVYKAILKSQFSNDVIFLLCAQIYSQGRDRNRIDLTSNLFETPSSLREMALTNLATRK